MIRFEEGFGGTVSYVNPHQVLRVRGEVQRWQSRVDGGWQNESRMDTYIDLYGTSKPVYLYDRDPAEVAALIEAALGG